MRENEWTNTIKELLQGANLGDDICFDILNKVPYAQEVLSYNLDFEKDEESSMAFETDLLVYEKADTIKPRIIIEMCIRDSSNAVLLVVVCP